jgi:methionyl-tRNA formyltransferase
LILPPSVLQIPRLGCINIHASLLPRWRGAAPIHRAIEAGDRETGITIMQMDEGLDTGAMLCHEAEIIRADDTTASLHDRLAAMGGRLIVDVLRRLEQGTLPATAQPQSGVCYADKIRKDEAALDFRLPAAVLFRRIRAFNPFPGALAQVGGVALKIWRAELTQHHGQPGEIVAAGPGELIVACGEGALRLVELQKPSGKRLPAAEFLKGFPLQKGQRFEVHS